MYAGQRPIRAMLGSQGGLGEFDTSISGKPDKLNIWVREEETGTIKNFVIKNPNFFKNYAFDFRDGEVIEYERVLVRYPYNFWTNFPFFKRINGFQIDGRMTKRN
uniref:Uncharacterized protein n=1 Tax=Globodera rostochiensis TaxID=31243 RepID=A0A914ICI3_GLORO